MKTMKCSDLGGACEMEFKANSFEELVEMSKKHGKEMFERGDKAHLDAMSRMKELMMNPSEVQRWFEIKRQEFESL